MRRHSQTTSLLGFQGVGHLPFRKLFTAITVMLLAVVGYGQVQPVSTNATASGYVCVQRGPNSRVWQSETFMTNAVGDVTTNFQTYTELATGVCYSNSSTGGQWLDSVEQVEAVPGGAQAVQGRHQVYFTSDADTPTGNITVVMPDGKQLSSTVFGLAYFDTASGSNAPVAYLQHCQGAIVANNQVVYSQAFTNLNADILYTYTKAGLSQDVVLHQAPPAPHQFGLSDATTVLQVYTAFINPPMPTATCVTNGNVVDDQVLSWGAMSMGVGQTLFVNGQESPLNLNSVQKQWVQYSNSWYLIESIGWGAISNQLSGMPQASNLNPKRGSARRMAFLDRAAKGDHKQEAMKVAQTETGGKGLNSTGGNGGNGEVRMPGTGVRRDFNTRGAKGAKRDIKEAAMKVGKLEAGGKRLLVDYDLLSSTTNLTLQGDSTYLCSSLVNVTQTLTIEGGTVIKYSGSGEINVSGSGSNIVCETGPYRPAVFTSVYDGTVGQVISNGTPTVAHTYVNFTVASSQPITLRYLRFSYASTAVSAVITANPDSSDWIRVWDTQFYQCTTAVAGQVECQTATFYLYNVLFADVYYGFEPIGSNTNVVAFAENVTADQMEYFAYNLVGANATAANCIFTAVTNKPAS